MDIVPHAAGALSVLGSINSVSRLASVANNIRSVTTTLGSLKRRISDERANLRNLRQRVREHEASSNSPRTTTQNRRMARRGRRLATTVRRKRVKPTDSRPSPYVIPKNITLAQCLGKELKHVYTSNVTASSDCDATSTVWHAMKSSSTTNLETLIPIARGTGDSERDARAVCLQWTSIKGTVTLSSQSDASMANIKSLHLSIVLVLDRQASNAGIPVNGAGTPDDQIDGLYELGSLPAFLQPIDPDDKQRFKILKRKDFVFEPKTLTHDGTNYVSAPHRRKWKMFTRFNGLEALYSGATGAATELVSNNLFLAIAYQGTPPTFTIQCVTDTAFTG